jgi:hypothetical protein
VSAASMLRANIEVNAQIHFSDRCYQFCTASSWRLSYINCGPNIILRDMVLTTYQHLQLIRKSFAAPISANSCLLLPALFMIAF